jgi:Uncharacterized protein conserved in bacteria (DUF2059)
MGLIRRTTMLCTLVAMPVLADPQADRKLLAETLYSDGTLDAAFQVMIPVLSGAMETQFRNLGLTISDPVAFTDIFAEEFRVKFAEIIRADMADALKDIFTDEETADIVAFVGTPSGAKFFATQGELVQVGSRLGELAGARAGLDAAERIAARMDAAGITFTDASGTTLDALKVLRGY